MDAAVFKQSLLQSLLNPKDRESILNIVKQLTPQFNDEERTRLFDVTMNQLQNPSSSSSSTLNPILKNDNEQRLALLSKSVEEIIQFRNAYYEQHQLPPPENYVAREDMSKWDMIDIYETAFVNDVDKLSEYKTFLMADN